MVHAFFEPDVASEILKIPIARHGGKDFVSFPHTKHGNYTVRSAYYFALSNKFFQAQGTAAKGNTSYAKAVEKDWKALWRIKAPGKMIIHLWRLVHNCLPSGVELSKIQVSDTGTCVFCDRSEDIVHALLSCQFARMVWREVKQTVSLQL
jgi:hypothetical protein